MTPAEATQFFESAFIAFPGLAAWLRETSTDGRGDLFRVGSDACKSDIGRGDIRSRRLDRWHD